MTSVSGHLTGVQFGPEYKDWSYPPPEDLFEAPVIVAVDEVGIHFFVEAAFNRLSRTR
jgi:hypothetical protein